MEAAAIFGLTCNVLQVVQLAWDITQKGIEIYKAGSDGLIENQHYERITDDLRKVSQRLSDDYKSSKFGDSEEELELKKLCRECDLIAFELLQRLNSYKISKSLPRWDVLKDTARAMYHLGKDEKYLKSVRDRLDGYRNQVEMRILFQLRNKMSALEMGQIKAFQNLDFRTQDIINLSLDNRRVIQESTAEQTEIILREIRKQGIRSTGRSRSISPFVSDVPEMEDTVEVRLSDSKDSLSIFSAAEKGDRSQIRNLIRKDARCVFSSDDNTRKTPLHITCEKGYLDCSDYLLRNMAKINDDDDDGMTPLHYAVKSGNNPALVRLLMHKGADPGFRNDEGKTPAFYAHKDSEVYFTLKYGPRLDARNDQSLDALNHFSFVGNAEAVKSLIEQGADPDIRHHNGGSPLFFAAKNGHLDVIDALVAGKADIDLQDNNETTPLLYASFLGQAESVRKLLDHGAGLHAVNKFGYASISDACNHGHDLAAKLLMEHGADVEHEDGDGYHPLNRACRDGRTEIVRLLLQHKADPNFRGGSNGEWTPLHEACQFGYLDCVKLLLQHGANPDVTQGEKKYYPICQAAMEGHADIVAELLDEGKADINAANSDGWTALAEAVVHKHIDVVRVLTARGANLESRNCEGWTPLNEAAFHRAVNAVRLLLKHGADLNARNDDGETPLKLAARAQGIEVMKRLIDRGADLNLADNQGDTALCDAASLGHKPAVILLLDHGAETDKANNEGYSPLNLAAMKGHPQVLNILLDRGRADIEHRNNGGWSSVMEAAFWGRKDMVNELISRGARVDHKDFRGRDAIVLAGENGHVDIQRILRDAAERQKI